MKPSKILLFIATATAIGLFFYVDGGRWLSFAALKTQLTEIQAWRASQPLLATAVFFMVYVLVTALSLPGAAAMTLAAGAVFGLVWGSVLVSFASSIGALLAFLLARYLFRDVIEARWSQRLGTINEGLDRDGAFYLFTLRLVPVIPFFLINLLLGLTRMPARTFYWVSQAGMLPGTLVYVNAGTRLAEIDAPLDLLSVTVLGAFALLAAFPWITRIALRGLDRRRRYARWRRPARSDRNLIVIGAGAAGLVTAYIAAAVKARVTLIESHAMGGDCLNSGCVPSKALIQCAKLAHRMRQAGRWGLDPVTPSFSFKAVMARVHAVIAAIAPHDSVERYTALGVEVRRGHARLVDPWTVEVRDAQGNRERLSARSIVLATGARPSVPALPGLESVDYLTSENLWDRLKDREQAPQRLLVLGGGPIGCELAQGFARLGVQVTQVEMMPQLMGREDEEVCDFVRRTLEAEGVQVLVGQRAVRVERDGERKWLVVAGSAGEQRLLFDEILVAVGRQARLEGYGLEELGIPAQRTIQTNDYLETVYPNIYVAGDAAGPYQFTHAAAHQAWYAAVNALFGRFKRFKVDHSLIPAVTFVDPEVARVGVNEREARERGLAYEVTRYDLRDLDRAIAEGHAEGWIKLLTVPGRDRILGVTIVGERAGDMLAEFVLAMKHGLGLKKILATIHPYPTWAEANKLASGAWQRTRMPPALLRWLRVYHDWMRT
ncbi:FAD-dependent oxidoreductase [Sinimarinibacterium thermocellulolyticum]|uniref:FAD-dependent oxidoreductase n=1 Tax=Sinimarinibacterium thermocellulolyticum TaxID=3170016 RepID=A0ABV2A9G2_9GAMM